jgi:hypothetical protein
MSMDFHNSRWEDYQLLGKSRATGPTIPTDADRSGGCFMWRIDNTTHTLYSAIQMPHSWNELTIKPHVHWEPRNNATYTGTWQMGFIWANVHSGSIVQTGLPAATGSFNFAGTIGSIMTTDLTDITLVNPDPSACIQAFLKLSSFTSGTGCWIWGWDFHYQKNRPGTINPTMNP